MNKSEQTKMLKRFLTMAGVVLIIAASNQVHAQNGVGINPTGAAADPSAALDVASTNKGVLVPRMTEAEKIAIASPANGLLIYQTDGVTGFWYYNGSIWVQSVGPQGPTGVPGPQGATGLLTSGAVAGNTPYWNGSAWVVNNSNIYNNGAGVGIGTSTPSASAKVEIASTTQGFLPPRMTTAQRDAITSPSIGLVIYNTTTGCLNYFLSASWVQTCGSAEQPIVQPSYPVGSVFCSGATLVVNVVNPATGKIWMDRNLGASQAATSSTDAAAYGDLYQWGRSSDGHQCRNSATTTILSSTDQPGNGNFILATSTPFDWRSPQNTNLWQGVNGANNPCPSGYRIPTEIELDAERLSWISDNSAGAFASPLRLPATGYRLNSGSLIGAGAIINYWSSGVSSTYSRALLFYSSLFGGSIVTSSYRAEGVAVRCIKN
jgi:uncharacterized protein (TIGR02145 family)